MRIARRVTDILKACIRTKLEGSDAQDLVLNLLKNISGFALNTSGRVNGGILTLTDDDLGRTIFVREAATINADQVSDDFQCALIKASTGDLTYTGFLGEGTIQATQNSMCVVSRFGRELWVFGKLT